jgi:tRNA(fMet)-specific endonuclease VapC
MNYLLDTCVISDFFKKVPNVLQKFESLSPKQIHISSVSVMEIEYGLMLNPEKEIKIRPIWNQFLKHIQIIPYSQECAVETSYVRAKLKTKGLPIGPYDILIAGTALANNLIVVTSNHSEFNRISKMQIENWRE